MPNSEESQSPAGRSGSSFWTGFDREEQRRMEEWLNIAIEKNMFEIYYQPLYSICDGNFTEAEALLRLKGPDGVYIPPDRFIPVAEETGQIIEIGCMVLERVCEYIRYLLACRINIDTVSVNLSVVQLMGEDAVPRLKKIIRGSGISPNRILFEITESILISNYTLIAEKIRELNRSGIQFALDDFGTGYSNITNVIDLPFDVVKIDKSLIWDSMKNRRCNIMIRELTRTFRNINLIVTAEGVETEEHDRFARQCGCDKIQGFRYAKPMPVSRAADYFGRCAVSY
ncbi:putative signaling protein [Caprobacter fermentans]|uniref:EAL domain-containing protein n=1 Tax=Caproicibacter fermentans TaxID=2576756 RepID=A0A6N8HZW8_9FIRM|nr:EAL domain-containing protein [Caproicibacter fermentans]MVB11135.1 putative signaling protein [Caproicibacter fermentans]QNK39289.1 EAL domain-containing protein [Caproicibacter fermentans]